MNATEIIIVVLCGLGGGVLNCFLARDKCCSLRETLSNLFLGFGASVIIWGFGASDLPLKKMIAFCLLSGIGGGNIITSMLQKQDLLLEAKKVEITKATIQELVDRLKELNR